MSKRKLKNTKRKYLVKKHKKGVKQRPTGRLNQFYSSPSIVSSNNNELPRQMKRSERLQAKNQRRADRTFRRQQRRNEAVRDIDHRLERQGLQRSYSGRPWPHMYDITIDGPNTYAAKVPRRYDFKNKRYVYK